MKQLELGTLLAGAEIPARIHFVPDGAVFGKVADLGAVPGLRGFLPLPDELEIGYLFQPIQQQLLVGVVNFLSAGVIVAALHVTDAERAAEMFFQEGNILVKKLVLEVLGSR